MLPNLPDSNVSRAGIVGPYREQADREKLTRTNNQFDSGQINFQRNESPWREGAKRFWFN
jgi:hypothetical protein